MTYEDALAILRDGWPITPEDLTQIAAHIWDEGYGAHLHNMWLEESVYDVSDEEEQTNPYRASETA